ncbi:MAG: hypothetical protein U9N59_12875 [Campylobacterota bacterium]|nr:hypothetical protein [Campylobacterota bacterium]
MCRLETRKNKFDVIRNINHNARLVKVKSEVYPRTNDNFRWGTLKNNFKTAYELREYLKNNFNRYVKQHKQVYYEYGKERFEDGELQQQPYLNTERVSSFSEGIIGFSEYINTYLKNNPSDGLDTIEKITKEVLLEFSKNYNVEVFDYAIHANEAGLLHIHFTCTNFNKSTGAALDSRRIGIELQDLVHSHFKVLGFERGRSKSKSEFYQDDHLSNYHYQQQQEKIKSLDKVENSLHLMSLDELEEFKITHSDNKLLKRLTSYIIRIKKKEKQLIEDSKTINYLKKSIDTIYAGGAISAEEAKHLYFVLKGSNMLKHADEVVRKGIKKSLELKP